MEAAPLLAKSSPERIWKELRQILSRPFAPVVLRRMAEDGVLQAVLQLSAPLAPDGHALRAVGSLWRAVDGRASRLFGPAAHPPLLENAPVEPARPAGADLALESLALLLGASAPEEVEAVCLRLRLSRAEQRSVSLHCQRLCHVPDSENPGEVRRYMSSFGAEQARVRRFLSQTFQLTSSLCFFCHDRSAPGNVATTEDPSHPRQLHTSTQSRILN